MLFSMLRHFLNPWSVGYPWLRTANSVYIWNNTVVFLPVALSYGTCKHYSVFKVLPIYSHTGRGNRKCTG